MKRLENEYKRLKIRIYDVFDHFKKINEVCLNILLQNSETFLEDFIKAQLCNLINNYLQKYCLLKFHFPEQTLLVPILY